MLSIVIALSSAQAQEGPVGFGLGIVLGEPSGLSLASRNANGDAIQSHLSWSLVHDYFRGNVDGLWSFARAEVADDFDLNVAIGVGAIVAVGPDDPFDRDGDGWLGGRIPFQLAALPDRTPLDVFVEVAPVLYVFPETDAGLEGSIGARYFF